MLDLWGGGGGLLDYRAALLGSHGYVTMAVEYFKVSDAQAAEPMISYFEVCVFLFF